MVWMNWGVHYKNESLPQNDSLHFGLTFIKQYDLSSFFNTMLIFNAIEYVYIKIDGIERNVTV